VDHPNANVERRTIYLPTEQEIRDELITAKAAKIANLKARHAEALEACATERAELVAEHTRVRNADAKRIAELTEANAQAARDMARLRELFGAPGAAEAIAVLTLTVNEESELRGLLRLG